MPLCSLLDSGTVDRQEVEDAHTILLEYGSGGWGENAADVEVEGEDEGTGVGDVDRPYSATPAPQVAVGLLLRPLGRTLLAHSRSPDALLRVRRGGGLFVGIGHGGCVSGLCEKFLFGDDIPCRIILS